ncbi:YqzL family protein [Cohnella caldifontis]|uniref:YqzL family protein n=1 Tax=Cohnella caldifontis TaxID=3027471 RepID=UPI0023EBC6A1|nr:YqzL family protein [Cohnella sp. YIM B05605]
MRDFSWHVFTQTGDIEAYLLYKEMDALGMAGPPAEDGPDEEDGSAAGEALPS